MGNGSSTPKKTSNKANQIKEDWVDVRPFDIPELWQKHKENQQREFDIKYGKRTHTQPDDLSDMIIMDVSFPPSRSPSPKPSQVSKLKPANQEESVTRSGN